MVGKSLLFAVCLLLFHFSLSIRPHTTSELPIDFQKIWYSIFWKMSKYFFRINQNLRRKRNAVHERLRKFVTISRWIWIYSGEWCGESENIHFMINIFFFWKSLLLSDHETRHGEAGRAIADNVAHAHCTATNTHSEYITAPPLDEGVAMFSFTYSVLLFVIIAIWRENM